MLPPRLFVTVTLFADASKLTVLPNSSCAVNVFTPVKAVPDVCGLAKLTANFANAPGVISNGKLPPPLELIVPSVTLTVVSSDLYPFNVLVPTPLTKVTTVVNPKSMSTAFLLLAVGTLEGVVDVENTKFLSPA
ncbi:hypothetical protein AQEC111735_11970 [Aquirufa ecclesiirivi]